MNMTLVVKELSIGLFNGALMLRATLGLFHEIDRGLQGSCLNVSEGEKVSPPTPRRWGGDSSIRRVYRMR